MSRAMDRLLDMFREPQWSWPAPTMVREEVVPGCGFKMLIDAEAEDGPLLLIVSRTTDGTVTHTQRFNLAGLDEHIGRLIEMRDKLAKLGET